MFDPVKEGIFKEDWTNWISQLILPRANPSKSHIYLGYVRFDSVNRGYNSFLLMRQWT